MIYLPSEFPLDPELCYLNHAAIGPWPRRTAQVVASFAQQSMLEGGTRYPDWLVVEQRLRERLARLINAADPDDIALVKNTSEGLSIVSQGLDWRDGDEVVGLHGDFCSNEMVWQALADRGVRYSAVDALATDDPEAALIAALGERTRLLALSTVHFATGYRFDVTRVVEACHMRGVLVSLDAIQSLGAVKFDLQSTPADFVVAGGHKWLLSPEGLGFLYCRPALRELLTLHQFGWAMRDRPYEFESSGWRPALSARRFESGTPNMTGIHALDASLSLFEDVGLAYVEKRVVENIAYLDERLRGIDGVEIATPAGSPHRAGILTYRHTRIPGQTLHASLMAKRVICSPRAGGIRLAPHFYTPEKILERTIEHIDQTIQNIIKNN